MSANVKLIYDSLKRKATVPKTENEIIEQAYTLGMQFAKQGLKKPIAKLNEGGVIADKDNDIIAMEAIHDLKHSYPEKYNKLRETAAKSPEFMRWLEESYKHVTENEGETRDFESWMRTSGFDEKIMGFLYPVETGYDKDNLPYGSLRGELENFQKEWEAGLKNEAVSNIVIASEEEASNYPFKEGTTHDYQFEDGQGKIYKKSKNLDLEKTQVPKLQDGGSIADPFKTDFNYDDTINSINENLSQRGVPTVDLRILANTVSDFLKDGGMASKMYSVTSGEISMEELRAKRNDMFNSLVSVSQFESSLGNAKKDKNGVIDHGNSNTTGMFGIQKGTVETLHDNGTLDKNITWEMISTNPELANSVGALNVLQISSRAYNRTESFPTPMQSVLLNRAGVNGSLTNNVYDKEKGMSTFTPKEIQNYEDTNTFMNEIGIGN